MRFSNKQKNKDLAVVPSGMSAAPLICDMNTLQAFFESLAEPTRLAILGASFVLGAVLLRKLLLPVPASLESAAKQPAVESSK